MKFLSDILARAGLVVDGTVTLNSVANATTDTDRFIVVDSGVVKYRTGTQLLSDIGGISGNQTITLSGDATGSGTTSIALTLANSGVTAGTYRSVTVDVKGRVTAGTNPTTVSGYGITDFYAQVISGFAVGANSTVTTSDTLETAIEKLQGQVNARQASLNGTGFVRMAGTTVSYITGTSAQFVKANGSLDSSSYFANGDYYAPNALFGQRPLRSQIVDNVLYQADSRFAVTRTDNSTRLGNALFNGNYDQTALTIAAGTSLTFNINFTANGNSSITYTEGDVYLHFYYTSVPASVSGRVKDSGGTWRNITGWTNVSTNGSNAVWRGNVPSFNYLTDMEITITAPAGGTANFSQWEYVMGRPGLYEWGVISKMQNNNLWTNLNFRNGTNASTISLVASTGVVTAASFVRTSGTSSQFLKADGSVDSTTYHSDNSIWSQVFGVYAVGANTAITNTDTLETALEKLQGQVNARLTGNQTITVSGDASGSGATAIALTLATVNSNVGTFNNVTVNAKGLVTAASNVSYLTGNQSISLTGEATGSGATSIAVTLTNSAVIGKVLTGLNITGGTVAAADTILTAFGKLQNQVNGLTGGVTYQGTWNASTNTPTLASSAGTKGFYYVVSVAGSTALNGVSTWSLGDWVIYNGTAWEKVDNTDAVISVNGFTGAVSLTTANVSESGNLYYTDARARASLSFTAGSGAYNSSTGVITIPTNTNQLTNGAGFITSSALSPYLLLAGGNMTGNIAFGSSGAGLTWAANTDGASITFESTGDGASGGRALSNLLIALTDNGDEGLKVTTTGAELLYVNINQFQYKGSNVWTAASLTNLNQLTNGPGYITGNQTITLTGNITGSGTTSIATTIANGVVTNAMLANSSFNIGTTSISLGRASAAQTLSGVSIDGTAKYLQNNYIATDANLLWQSGVYSFFNGTNVPGGDFGMISIPTWGSTDGSNRYNLQIGSNIGGNPVFRTTNISGAGTWYTFWHSGNLTNLNQLTNGPGYITGYTETDTLASVTARGASTSTATTIANDVIQQTSLNISGAFYYQVRKSRGSVASPLAVNANDDIGGLLFLAYDGANWTSGAGIRAQAVSVATGAIPMRLEFFTGVGSINTSTRRMTIDETGKIGINLNNPQAILDVSHTAGTTNIIRVSNGSGNYRWRVDQNFSMIMTNASGTDTFSVTTAGTLTAISLIKSGGTSSQYLMADGSVSTNPGWITSYTETDTLASVTGRGASTNTSITVGPDLVIQADGSANYTASRLKLNSHNNYRGAGMHLTGVDSNWFIGTPYTDFSGGFVIARKSSAASFEDTAQYSNALFTVKSDGKVGIGTTTPGAKLEVLNGDIWLNAASSGVNPEIRFIDDSGISVAGAKIRYGNADGNLYIEHIWDTTTSGIFFRNRTGGTALNTLSLVNGNVGINTTSPGYALHVVGNTFSTGVISNTFWTDDSIRKLSAGAAMNFRNSAGTIEMILNGSGNLAVGLSNPTTGDRVEIAGALRVHTGNNWDGVKISADGANGYIQGLGDETGLRIRSEYGNIMLGDDRGAVLIGATAQEYGEKLRVNGGVTIYHTYTQSSTLSRVGNVSQLITTTAGGAGYYGGLTYTAFTGAHDNTFNGSVTIPNSVGAGGINSTASIRFGAANVTVTMTQSGSFRSYDGVSSGIAPSATATGGSISHVSAFHALAPYYVGSNTPTITNYFGLLLNDSAEYSTWVAITNRWGIYQHGSGDNNYFAGKVMVGTTTVPTQLMYVNGTSYFNGNMTVNGTITELSTINIKTNVETLDGALDKVEKMRGVSYNRKDNHKKEIGFIAEEVDEVYPEFVEYDEQGSPVGLHYARLTAVLLQSVKELSSRIKELEKRN